MMILVVLIVNLDSKQSKIAVQELIRDKMEQCLLGSTNNNIIMTLCELRSWHNSPCRLVP